MIRVAVLALAACLLAACAAPPPAPVTDRSAREQANVADRPEAHIVRRGDTLYSIAFRYGLDWRRVADWNRIGAPYTIHPGEVLRLHEPRHRPVARVTRPDPVRQPPAGRPQREAPSSGTAEPGAGTPMESSPPAASAGQSGGSGPTGPDPQLDSDSQPTSESASRAPAPQGPERRVGNISWRWPAAGKVVRNFDNSAARKGLGIAGSAGDPVRAAANGRVVYSGSGLLGYGELIIIKHSDSLLSAYGNNRARRVEEGDSVSAGQLIAELGVNERNDPMLHFEIRLNGQPENPLKYLPAR